MRNRIEVIKTTDFRAMQGKAFLIFQTRFNDFFFAAIFGKIIYSYCILFEIQRCSKALNKTLSYALYVKLHERHPSGNIPLTLLLKSL